MDIHLAGSRPTRRAPSDMLHHRGHPPSLLEQRGDASDLLRNSLDVKIALDGFPRGTSSRTRRTAACSRT